MAPDPKEDRDLLSAAAIEAGKIARKHFRTNVRTYEKPDDAGPVTAADLEINEMLEDRLGRARPDYGWLSEESEDNEDRLDKDRVFIIDPIDGTRAFIEGYEGFSVALAVAERGQVIAAAVDLPALGELYSAARGQGTTNNDRDLAVTGPASLDEATVLAAQVQMRERNWAGGVPPLTRHFRSSLAWRMCLVADSRFDTMLTFRRSYEWDLAAGALILSEAGAKVTDGWGQPLRFNSPAGMQDGVIAAPLHLHDQIMDHRMPGRHD
ncbi:MAG: 3'(2'),5'-bisphosphate nucleotidase CysQ [Pseudomonadota bacterium]